MPNSNEPNPQKSVSKSETGHAKFLESLDKLIAADRLSTL